MRIFISSETFVVPLSTQLWIWQYSFSAWNQYNHKQIIALLSGDFVNVLHNVCMILILNFLQMALSAASPVHRGLLADNDCRWNVISAAVDDRTREERGLEVHKCHEIINVLKITGDKKVEKWLTLGLLAHDAYIVCIAPMIQLFHVLDWFYLLCFSCIWYSRFELIMIYLLIREENRPFTTSLPPESSKSCHCFGLELSCWR